MNPDKNLYFEEIGDDFERFMSDYDVERRLVLIDNLLGGRGSFQEGLEVGCGTGRISRALHPRVANLMVSDISEVLASKVGEREGCSHSAENACDLSFANDRFDLIFSSECIEHTPDPLEALKEMARVLAPGGTMVVTTPNRLWYPILWIAEKTGLRDFEGVEHWISPGQAKKALQSAGLDIVRTSGCHLFPWQVPGSKKILPFFDRFGDSFYPIMINFGIAAQKKDL